MRNIDWTRARFVHGDGLGLTRRQLTGLFSSFVTVLLSVEVSVAEFWRRMPTRDWSHSQDGLRRAFA